MKSIPKILVDALIEAALDQPNPSEDLKMVLQAALRAAGHKDALR